MSATSEWFEEDTLTDTEELRMVELCGEIPEYVITEKQMEELDDKDMQETVEELFKLGELI